MDENQCDERLRQTFRLAAPQVDSDSFCRTSLAREAGNAEKPRYFRRAGNRGLKLGWRIAVAAVGGVVVAAAVAAAVASSRATADESPLATLDVHMTTELELRYLPDHSNWSETYVTILSPPMSDADLAAAIKEGKKPGVRVEQSLYQNGAQFVQVRTVTDTGEPLPSGSAVEVNDRSGVLQTGISGLLQVTEPDLPAEFLGAQPDSRQMTTTTAGPDVSGGDGVDSSGGAPAPASPEPTPFHDAIRLSWIVDGTRVAMLSNLPAEELVRVGESLVLGTTK